MDVWMVTFTKISLEVYRCVRCKSGSSSQMIDDDINRKSEFAPFCTNAPLLCAKKIQSTHGAPWGKKLSSRALATVLVQVFLALDPTEIESSEFLTRHVQSFLRLAGSSIPMLCEY